MNCEKETNGLIWNMQNCVSYKKSLGQAHDKYSSYTSEAVKSEENTIRSICFFFFLTDF